MDKKQKDTQQRGDLNAPAERLGERAKQPARPGSPADADRREAEGKIAEVESGGQPGVNAAEPQKQVEGSQGS
ncbi:MAG TPA: hypothetical protein VFS21_17825 [Roseiflexaceae bacterium]|nr:hypothetical protein [Roseiflexaceae bacterium]